MLKSGEFKANYPNQVWSWDITFLLTEILGKLLKLYTIIDIYSRFIVGWEIHHEELSEHAATLVIKSCIRHGVIRNQLVLHSDNGSPMKGATMLVTLQRLGVMPSFSRPSVSSDNAYSEAIFKTLKYMPDYPRKPFKDIVQERSWVLEFVNWYNYKHMHSGVKFVTPADRLYGRNKQILADLKADYEAAKASHTRRWNNSITRNWDHIKEVLLYPLNVTQKSAKIKQIAA